MGFFSGITDAISGAVSDLTDAGLTLAEKKMLQGYFFFLPESTIDWLQSIRISWFGVPDVKSLAIEATIIPFVLAGILYLLKGQLYKIYHFYSNGITGKLHDHWQRLFFIVSFTLIICYIIYLIYTNYIKPKINIVNSSKNAVAAQNAASTTSGFKNPSKSVENNDTQYKLVNIQPLAVKQAGFLGPTEDNGTFNPEVTIMNAIRLGARFFTLQIDYLDNPKDSKLFDPINTPTLLYRNRAGHLISTNGANIKNVAEQLATYSFSPNIRDQTYPIIVYLHFVRAPDAIRKPKEYLNFMMKVAEALKPIQQYILKDTLQMSFRRQQNETALVELDLTTIQKSIILLSNADTTLFRNTKPLGMTVEPTSDLDSLVNMRVYLESTSDSELFGITKIVEEKNPSAIIVPYSRLLKMSQKDRDSFAMKNKKRFVIAMPGQLDSPKPDDMKLILNETGINVIPLNLIGHEPKQITTLVSNWGSDPFYKVKPMMLQSFKMGVSGIPSNKASS
jgi:hypothetical protein